MKLPVEFLRKLDAEDARMEVLPQRRNRGLKRQVSKRI